MISGNTQCYHHVPLIILVVIAGTDKERPGCSKIQNMAPRKNSCGVSTLQKQKLSMARFCNRYRHTVIDYRSYQMSHSVSIPMIFVSAIFARATLTGKMVLTAKMCELHLLPKWRPTRVHKKSRTQFWLSDSSVLSIICDTVL